jgi:hypothetical protein
MQWKAKLAAAAFGAALLAGITVPAASASAAPATTAASSSSAPFCNYNSAGDPYGCAVSRGLAKAVTLAQYRGTTTPTDFTYSNGEIQQAGTDLCLNYNPDSSGYPVNMDTCTGSPDEIWQHPSGISSTKILWENDGSASCLEGSEVVGFGKPLVMVACDKPYAGLNWGLL